MGKASASKARGPGFVPPWLVQTVALGIVTPFAGWKRRGGWNPSDYSGGLSVSPGDWPIICRRWPGSDGQSGDEARHGSERAASTCVPHSAVTVSRADESESRRVTGVFSDSATLWVGRKALGRRASTGARSFLRMRPRSQSASHILPNPSLPLPCVALLPFCRLRVPLWCALLSLCGLRLCCAFSCVICRNRFLLKSAACIRARADGAGLWTMFKLDCTSGCGEMFLSVIIDRMPTKAAVCGHPGFLADSLRETFLALSCLLSSPSKNTRVP